MRRVGDEVKWPPHHGFAPRRIRYASERDSLSLTTRACARIKRHPRFTSPLTGRMIPPGIEGDQ